METWSAAPEQIRTTMAMVKHGIRGVALLLVLGGSTGCMSPRGATAALKRQDVEYIRARTVGDVAARKPGLSNDLARAAGYAVFRNRAAKFNLGIRSGYGVILNNRTGERFYRRGRGLDIGIGAGLRNYRTLVVLDTAEDVAAARDRRFNMGVSAGVAFRLGDFGPAGSAIGISGAEHVYTVSDNGLALDFSFGFGFVRRDRKLDTNAPPSAASSKSE